MSLSNIVASLRGALLVEALGQTSWLDKPPHHVKVIWNLCENNPCMWFLLWIEGGNAFFSTEWLVFNYEVFSGPYFPYSVRIQARKCGPEKFCIWTLFTQCRPWIVGILYQISNIEIKYIHCWLLRNLWVINNEVVLKSWITWSCRSLGQIAVTCKCF